MITNYDKTTFISLFLSLPSTGLQSGIQEEKRGKVGRQWIIPDKPSQIR